MSILPDCNDARNTPRAERERASGAAIYYRTAAHDPAYAWLAANNPHHIERADDFPFKETGLDDEGRDATQVSDVRQAELAPILADIDGAPGVLCIDNHPGAPRPDYGDRERIDGDEVLSSSERKLEVLNERLRALIERRELYAYPARPLNSAEAYEHRAKCALGRLRAISTPFECEIAATIVDADFENAGYRAAPRRDMIAAALGVSVRTVVSLIVRGRRSLDLAAQMAKAAAAEAAKPKVAQSISARTLATGTTLPNIAKATNGTQFDSRERRAGIAAMCVDEQCEFVALLEQQAVESEIDATDALDRKCRAKLLPHSILNKLDACDRNREGVRRMLAGLDHDERKRLVAEWIREAIDDAIAGSATQRQRARSSRTDREYAEMARVWIRHQRETIKVSNR